MLALFGARLYNCGRSLLLPLDPYVRNEAVFGNLDHGIETSYRKCPEQLVGQKTVHPCNRGNGRSSEKQYSPPSHQKSERLSACKYLTIQPKNLPSSQMEYLFVCRPSHVYDSCSMKSALVDVFARAAARPRGDCEYLTPRAIATRQRFVVDRRIAHLTSLDT